MAAPFVIRNRLQLLRTDFRCYFRRAICGCFLALTRSSAACTAAFFGSAPVSAGVCKACVSVSVGRRARLCRVPGGTRTSWRCRAMSAFSVPSPGPDFGLGVTEVAAPAGYGWADGVAAAAFDAVEEVLILRLVEIPGACAARTIPAAADSPGRPSRTRRNGCTAVPGQRAGQFARWHQMQLVVLITGRLSSGSGRPIIGPPMNNCGCGTV